MKKFHRQRKSSWSFDFVPGRVLGLTIKLGKLALALTALNSISSICTIFQSVHAHPQGRLFSSSPSHLMELAEMESNIYKLMIEYRQIYQKRLDVIERYIHSYDETFSEVVTQVNGSNTEEIQSQAHSTSTNTDSSEFPSQVDNNVVSFAVQMEKRITIDIPHMISDVTLDHEKGLVVGRKTPDLLQRLYEVTPTEWTNLENSKAVKNAIIKLQDVYNFDLLEFTEGKFFDFPASIGLTGFQCYEIGAHAFNAQRYALAVEWLAVALEKIKRKSERLVSEEIAADTLRIACETHDKQWELENISIFNPTGSYETNLTSASFFTNKISTNDVSSPIHKRSVAETYTFKGNTMDDKYNGINFRYLCSQGNFQTEEIKSKLYCWEESRSHPYWIINPQKMELLNQDPYLVQIYDFIDDNFGNFMIQRAEPHLQPSKLNTEFEDILENKSSHSIPGKSSSLRTSSVVWLNESSSTKLVLLSKKIEMITGLKVIPVNASEPLQVASYVVGGHYAPHLDYIQDERIAKYSNGNRLATFMIYLNQVDLGGYTVFPLLGTAAIPVKGSAVFWYNMRVDGTGADNRTWHGACPVIYGHKWASNKWIHFYENMFNWKCPRTLKVA